MSDTRPRDTPSGLLYGIAAYGWWGLVAAYFKVVREVPPLEILAHRIIWSVAFLIVLLLGMRRWDFLRAVVRDRRVVGMLALSALLVASNWLVFIIAVTTNRMLQSSLGYFITPLVSVLLGLLFLGERLRRLEWVSIGIAASAVLGLTLSAGFFPWISLLLAISFGLYGFVRKLAGVGAIEGLIVETALLLPLALGYLLVLHSRGTLAFTNQGARLDLLLLAAGPITALPLLWFAAAVRRLRLATVGLLQYFSPTIQFLIAVLLFDEPFGPERLVAFVLIWTAVAIFSFENLRSAYRRVPEAQTQ